MTRALRCLPSGDSLLTVFPNHPAVISLFRFLLLNLFLNLFKMSILETFLGPPAVT